MSILGDIFLLVGAVFLFLAALGMVRMPDVFNRIQTGTKGSTLGALSVLIGVFLHHPDWWAKLVVLAVFVLVTSPVGSSIIARAALATGLRPWHQPNDEEAA